MVQGVPHLGDHVGHVIVDAGASHLAGKELGTDFSKVKVVGMIYVKISISNNYHIRYQYYYNFFLCHTQILCLLRYDIGLNSLL